jgi:hypothetical protein
MKPSERVDDFRMEIRTAAAVAAKRASQPKTALSADDPPQGKIYFSMRIPIRLILQFLCNIFPRIMQRENNTARAGYPASTRNL